MVHCPGHVGPTLPARERVPARGNQVFAGTSGWDRMDASPVRRSLPTATGGRIPSSVRLSPIVTTGEVPGSFAGPRGDGFDYGPTFFRLAICRTIAASFPAR